MNRDWRVDSLRGYFLVVMTIGHFPNPVARFTEYTFGYASAPDGFVFLSGLVSAWIYFPVGERHGRAALWKRVLRRARDIYLVHVALMSLGIVHATYAAETSPRGLHPVRAFISGCLLMNQEGFDRILPMYVLFLLITPLVLGQFGKGRAWLVAGTSAALWIAAQFGVGADSNLPWIDIGNFNLLAWQAYFVAGQYLGYRGLRDLPVLPDSPALLGICGTVVVALLLDRHAEAIGGVKSWFGFAATPDHNPARFVDAACLGYLIWRIPAAVDNTLTRVPPFGFLNFLGRHSLQVFAFSMLLTRFEARYVVRPLPVAAKILVVGVSVVSLWIPAWLHQKYRDRRLQPGTPPVRLFKRLFTTNGRFFPPPLASDATHRKTKHLRA